ncbi:MAG: putative acetyltransferase [Alphaproteobacteria bacterium]|nr:putative acetyltransferase [Alphaproteobacteria bacterium]
MFNSYNHWRNTARPVRFFTVDYRAGIFVAIFLLHIRLWTFILLLAAMIILFLLERRGLTLPLAMRRIRVWFIGPIRPALGKIHHRDFRDSGGN